MTCEYIVLFIFNDVNCLSFCNELSSNPMNLGAMSLIICVRHQIP